MRGTIKKNYSQGKQETPQQNQDGYSCSRTTNQVGPMPLLTTSRGTHTVPKLQSVIDKWILHQETTAPSGHCELVKVKQVPPEARLRQLYPSKGKCTWGCTISVKMGDKLWSYLRCSRTKLRESDFRPSNEWTKSCLHLDNTKCIQVAERDL